MNIFLDGLVKDGKKIVDYQCGEIFAKGTKILPEDIAIMSLFKDLLDKAKSIDLIIVNNKSDDCNSLIRTFIEEYLYLRFILRENTSLRGKAYYFNYKLKGLKKIEKYLENVVDNDSKKIKNNLDRLIKETATRRENFEEEKDFYDLKYKELFPSGTKSNQRYNWFNVELKGIDNLEQLSKSTGQQSLYWFYNILSTDTHGFNAIRKFNVTNMDETISTVELIEEINGSSSATNLKPFLSRILIDVINHYKLQKKFKTIITKQLLNSNNRAKNR